MIERRSQEEIEAWAKELVLSHGGSISAKMIRGTVRHYLQWKEQGRYRSKYLRAMEVGAVRRQLARLRGKTVSEEVPRLEVARGSGDYETNVCTGSSLLEFAREAEGLLRRDVFPRIESFMQGPRTSKVLVVYGLRRTGKTTMIRQSILSLPGKREGSENRRHDAAGTSWPTYLYRYCGPLKRCVRIFPFSIH